MTTQEPAVSLTGRYNVSQTCEALGICPNTLRKYTASLAIRCKIRRATNMKFYTGEEIIRFWRSTY